MKLVRDLRIPANAEVIIRNKADKVDYSRMFVKFTAYVGGVDRKIFLTMPVSVLHNHMKARKMNVKLSVDRDKILKREIVFPANCYGQLMSPDDKISYEKDWVYLPLEIGEKAHAVLSMDLYTFDRLKNGADVEFKTN